MFPTPTLSLDRLAPPGKTAAEDAKLAELLQNAAEAKVSIRPASPFSPAQYQSLIEKVEANLGVTNRLDGLDSAWNEKNRAWNATQDRLQWLLHALDAKVGEVQRGLAEEQRLREASLGSFQEQLAAERGLRGELRAQVKGRLEAVEMQVGESTNKHIRGLEAMKLSQATLVDQAKAREVHHTSLEERCCSVESTSSAALERHAQELSLVQTHVGQLRGRLSDEERARQEVQGQFAQECDTWAALHVELKQRLTHVEDLLGISVEKTARELGALHAKIEQLQARLAEEAALQAEAQRSFRDQLLKECDVRDEAPKDRFSRVERSLSDHRATQAADMASARDKLDDLFGQVAEEHHTREAQHSAVCSELAKEADLRSASQELVKRRLDDLAKLIADNAERHTQEVDIVNTAHSKLLAEEVHARTGQHDRLLERLGRLDEALGHARSEQVQGASAAQARFDQLNQRLAEERALRESLREAFHDLVGKEREVWEAKHAALEEQVVGLKRDFGDAIGKHTRALQTLREAHGERMGLLEQKLADEATNLRGHVAGDRQLRAQHHDSVVEHLAIERRAREALVKNVEKQLARERDARGSHENALRALASQEREARERDHERVEKRFQELLAREKAQEAGLDAGREARQRVEELLAREKAEHSKHQESVLERFESVQRAVYSFHALLRSEMEARAAESRRLWDALAGRPAPGRPVEWPAERPAAGPAEGPERLSGVPLFAVHPDTLATMTTSATWAGASDRFGASDSPASPGAPSGAPSSPAKLHSYPYLGSESGPAEAGEQDKGLQPQSLGLGTLAADGGVHRFASWPCGGDDPAGLVPGRELLEPGQQLPRVRSPNFQPSGMGVPSLELGRPAPAAGEPAAWGPFRTTS